jgi:hypothetical protein
MVVTLKRHPGVLLNFLGRTTFILVDSHPFLITATPVDTHKPVLLTYRWNFWEPIADSPGGAR